MRRSQSTVSERKYLVCKEEQSFIMAELDNFLHILWGEILA